MDKCPYCGITEYAGHTCAERKVSELQVEIKRLRGIVDEVHAWAVCAPISTDSDMMQNISRIIEITGPPNPKDQGPA